MPAIPIRTGAPPATMPGKKPTLPQVDISPFLSWQASPDSRARCAQQLAAACRSHGFFYLIGHDVPRATTDCVLDVARRFFVEGTPEDKAAIARRPPGEGDGDGARGYQAVGENVTGGKRDVHEAVDVYSERASKGGGPPYGLLEGRNRWPERPGKMREVVEGYVPRMRTVGTAVVKAMGVALGLGEEADVFERNTRESAWILRLIGYPPLEREREGEQEANGDGSELYSCGTHTDYGCITLLLADETKGALQVQLKDGTWIDADPMEDAYVVNIGDMIERWTNGLWQSTKHRVIHRGDTYRVSVPFFFEPNLDAVIKPLDACVKASGEPPKYDEIVYRDHLVSKVTSNFY